MMASTLPVMLFISLAVFTGTAVAQPAIETSLNKSLLIGQQMSYFIDSSNKMHVDEAIRQAYTPSADQILNFGITSSSVWMKFSVRSGTEGVYYLEIMNPLMEQIELYVLNGNLPVPVFRGGFNQPFARRPVQTENWLFPISLKKDSVYTYYIKGYTGFNFQLPVTITPAAKFVETSQRYNLFWGMYIGTMIFALIYNLFIYLSVRERRYFYYILYIIGSTAFYLSIQGFTYAFLWPRFPFLNQHVVVLICLTNIAVMLFTLNFLKIDRRLKGQYYFGLSVIGVFFIIMLANIFGPYALSITPAQIMSLIISAYCIYVGFKSFRRGIHSAKYFLIAWTMFLTLVILFILTINNVVQSNFFTTHCIFIGHMTEVMLLSFALADRINWLKKENEKFQHELMNTQLEIQEQTFQNISQEIHDNVCQVLTLVKMNMNAMYRQAPDQLREKLSDSQTLLSKVLQDLRDLSKSLNTEFINQIGLEEAVRQQLGLLEKTGSFDTQIRIEGQTYRLSPQHELLVFRIVQELLNNIVKHADATSIRICIGYGSEKFTIQVQDNGRGFENESQHASAHKGIGLHNIKNRTSLLKGSLNILTKQGHGADITLCLPT